MALSLQEFDAKKFNRANRREEAYSAAEVTEFLNQIRQNIVSNETLQRDFDSTKKLLQIANERVQKLDAEVEELKSNPSAALSDAEADEATSVLVNARRVAAEVTANANAKAQSLVHNAEIRSDRLHQEADEYHQNVTTEADQQAQELRLNASVEAEAILSQARTEEEALRASIDKLNAERREIGTRLHAFLSQQLEEVQVYVSEDVEIHDDLDETNDEDAHA